jgi:hypothetical protein
LSRREYRSKGLVLRGAKPTVSFGTPIIIGASTDSGLCPCRSELRVIFNGHLANGLPLNAGLEGKCA